MLTNKWPRPLAGSGGAVRMHGMTANTLAGAPGSPVENHVDSAACAIACPPHGLRLAGSFCWFYRNDSDVEL
jgi:hypothetical protein